ncbi:hypothetical protein LTS08_008314 [Lithohypha guttulata]|nr:hypothetical protein LTS08_008314 [Lithohypha guttulata]
MINSPPRDLRGIFVALITPFTDDRTQIDAKRLQDHIDFLVDSGIHGIVPGGSTGEFTALSIAERKQLIELCVEYCAGRIPVVAGTGALTTKDCVELASHASQAGADALMVVPPFYDAVNYEQLKELLNEISSASNLPIMYYNIPSASGVTLSPEQLAGLSGSGVRYMKDTSGNAPALTELLFERQNEITTFNGWDTLTFYGLAAGAKGSVWGASNVIPELSAELWEAVAVQQDLKKGRELWSKIFPVCKFLESHHYASAVKTGMELRGWKTGGIRKPYALLADEPRKEFAQILEKADVNVVA